MSVFVFNAVFGLASLKNTLPQCTHSLFVFLTLLLLIPGCEAQFLVDVVEKTFGGWRLVHRCEAKGANFGHDVPTFSYGGNVTGCVSFAEPDSHACKETSRPPSNVSDCADFYAFVPRGRCGFSEKAYHVELASYQALIVYNKPGDSPIPMDGDLYKDEVHIPVVMVSYRCMATINSTFRSENGFKIAIRAIPGYYDLVKYLIPFVGVVGLCFTVLFLSLLFRVCRERRRIARKRLSRSNLKKLPTKKYKKGEEAESCVICLEEFAEGEKLRVLPCKHVYHCKCVDPWLTRNRKVCPICKRKVWSSGDSDSSDSDIERRNASASGPRNSTTRENAPLIDNELTSSVLSHSSYFDDGVLRDVGFLEVNRAGTSDGRATTSAIVHMNNNNASNEGSPYANTVVQTDRAETSYSASGVSAALKQKLRPFVQGIVDRASRTLRRDQKLLSDVSQLDAGELGAASNFSAENEAFDETIEGHNFVQVPRAACTSAGSVNTFSTLIERESTGDGGFASATSHSIPADLRRMDEQSQNSALTDLVFEADFPVSADNSVSRHAVLKNENEANLGENVSVLASDFEATRLQTSFANDGGGTAGKSVQSDTALRPHSENLDKKERCVD